VGFAPAWDITCKAAGLNWGAHVRVENITWRPAGKALNISRALAWLGEKSTAAGLWGRGDYEQMREAMRPLSSYVKIAMTVADGATRHNITVVDTAKQRDMHLRDAGRLATSSSLRRLREDLGSIVGAGDVCVFAGRMPEGRLLSGAMAMVRNCVKHGARVVVDTSGPELRKVVSRGGLWVVKPNVEELGALVGDVVRNNVGAIVDACRGLLDEVEVVIVSRGRAGAVIVTRDCACSGRAPARRGGGDEVLSTVGCGDYLLAGFLSGMVRGGDVKTALERAIKVATARAMGWTEDRKWMDVQSGVRGRCENVKTNAV